MTQMVTAIPVSDLVVGDRLVLSNGLDEVVLSFGEAWDHGSYFEVKTMSEAGPVRRKFQSKTSICGVRPRIQAPTRYERDVL